MNILPVYTVCILYTAACRPLCDSPSYTSCLYTLCILCIFLRILCPPLATVHTEYLMYALEKGLISQALLDSVALR